jgi:hypothetical protein
MPIERVITLLPEEFMVPCAAESAEWQPLLAESEAAFLEIGHDASPTGVP